MDINHKTKLPLFFAIGCPVALLPSLFLSGPERVTVTVTLLTMLGGVTSFLYAQHWRELQLFRELFREFNERYDKRNEQLNIIRSRPVGEPLQGSDKDVLCDYFNLCAEEQLYARAGCIDSNVWRAWQKGMRHFACDPEIREFWQQEIQQDSYYGFKIPE